MSSLYRFILRDEITGSDIHPYQEVDVRALLPEPEPQRTDDSPSIEARTIEDTETEEVRVALQALAPLILVTAAQWQVEEQLTQAQQEATRLQQEAYTHGVTLGREEGKEECQKELHAALAAFTQTVQRLCRFEEQLVSHFTPEIIRLALAISEKIVGVTVLEDPHITASVLERAKATVPHARHIEIWLHPVDYELLQTLRPDLVQTSDGGGRKVSIFRSEEISRGGCRVETEMGTVDATIPVQFEEISHRFFEHA